MTRYRRWRARYEWHPGDPMSLKWIVVWHMCQSRFGLVQRWGWRLWGD